MSDVIHIHEDEWGMRSLHPIAAWGEAARDVEAAIAAGERNRAPDGVGWTGLHVIEEPAVDFTGTGLRLADLAGQLERHMPRVRRFNATATSGFDTSRRDPLGSYEDDAWAFGFDAACFLKLEPRGDLIARIWFEACTDNADRLAALRSAIETVDASAEAIIVDYWADATGRVRDKEFIRRYFEWIAGQ